MDDIVVGDRPWHQVWPAHLGYSLTYPDEPAWTILTRNLPHHSKRVAIRLLDHETGTEMRSLTYAELGELGRRLAFGLKSVGMGAGDRVAFYLPNSPELVAAYYGTWMLGAVAVPCNPMSKEPELEYQLVDSGARLMLTSPELHATAARVAARAGVRLVVAPTNGESPDGLVSGDIPWGSLVQAGAMDPVRSIQVAEDLAVLLYTGGTTGTPKGAMLTHRNILVNTCQFSSWYGMEPGGEICVSVLPLCHSGGMSGAMNVPLFSGATMLLFKRFNPRTVLEAIARFRATRFFGVPTMYVAVLNIEGSQTYDLSSLRACRTGAAPLPIAVKAGFDGLVGREVLVEGYGLTETSPLTHANPTDRVKVGSVGIPLPDTDATILDLQTKQPVPVGAEGELCLRGPQVMKGYWNKPQETAVALDGNWFHTGDIARMDEEGYFYVVDRQKDVIISSGFKVWPREVEEVLYGHPGVRLAAVVGIPDEYRGEAVKAFVVPVTDCVTVDDLLDHCRQHLSNYKVPRSIEFRTELPTSGAGKILRRALRSTGTST